VPTDLNTVTSSRVLARDRAPSDRLHEAAGFLQCARMRVDEHLGARDQLVVDTTGLWFRSEGDGQFICGISPDAANDPDDASLDVDHALLDDVLRPALAARVPVFESIRQTRAWAGNYEVNTVDRNGIVGPHSDWTNLVFANGFSGRGIQQSPAVGRGVADLLVHGGYRTLDLSSLAFDRFAHGELVIELNVV
jgi:glycine/D-amino acid oxidase-like deaminating enzyme